MKIIFAITVFLGAYFGSFVGIFIGKAQEKQDTITTSRYINITELGFITVKTENSFIYGGSNKQYISSASIHSFHGYRFSPYFSLGTVIGLDWYDLWFSCLCKLVCEEILPKNELHLFMP